MATLHSNDLYDREIRSLPLQERLQLAQRILEDVAQAMDSASSGPPSSLLELEGLGAEIWSGEDAQAYVSRLRQEWNQRP